MDPHNSEFVRLLSLSGLSGAEAARRLGLDPSAISQYRSGHTRPSVTVLRLFSRIVNSPLNLHGESDEGPLAEPRLLDDWENEVLTLLRELPVQGRLMLIQSMKQMKAALSPPATKPPDRLPPTSETLPGVDPKVAAGARASLQVMDRIIRQGGQGQRPSSKAASTTDSKGGPPGGTPPHRNPQPPPPVRAQVERRDVGAENSKVKK